MREAETVSLDEVLGWAEFSCWVALVLAPILFYVNGPAVSHEQSLMRTSLVGVAAVSAFALRFVNWRRGQRENERV